jgi:hypothetical protein
MMAVTAGHAGRYKFGRPAICWTACPSELFGMQFGTPWPLEMALTAVVSSKVVERILADLHKHKAKSAGRDCDHLNGTVNRFTTSIRISTNRLSFSFPFT